MSTLALTGITLYLVVLVILLFIAGLTDWIDEGSKAACIILWPVALALFIVISPWIIGSIIRELDDAQKKENAHKAALDKLNKEIEKLEANVNYEHEYRNYYSAKLVEAERLLDNKQRKKYATNTAQLKAPKLKLVSIQSDSSFGTCSTYWGVSCN